MLTRASIGLGAFLAIAGCDSHKVPSPSDYDRTCTTVSDCAAVYIGPVGCCGGGCPNVAVRASVAQKAMNDVQAAAQCNGSVRPPCGSGAACNEGRVQCNAGLCELTGLPDGAVP